MANTQKTEGIKEEAKESSKNMMKKFCSVFFYSERVAVEHASKTVQTDIPHLNQNLTAKINENGCKIYELCCASSFYCYYYKRDLVIELKTIMKHAFIFIHACMSI